jgi:hypothetical protein
MVPESRDGGGLVLGKLRQEDFEFKANLSSTARPCLRERERERERDANNF